jgi:hypothetical protein
LNVTEKIAAAWKSVVDAGLPESLHEVGFKAALVMINEEQTPASPREIVPASASARVHQLPTPALIDPPAEHSNDAVLQPKSSGELLSKFAMETGIEEEDLEAVFYFDNGVPILNGPVRKLGGTTTEKTRTIALCLVSAYNYALDLVEIQPDVIRAECERLKCLDSKNFSSYVGSTKGVSYLGPTGKKFLKVKADTISLLADAVRSIREAS